MKVFSYIGSQRGSKSNTKLMVDRFIQVLDKRIEEPVESFVVTADMVNVETCTGCSMCFESGKCHLSKKDDMEKIIESLLEADIVLLGSPVYAHHVTGPFKNFIDRMSYNLYTFDLAGKFGITVSSSNSNGNIYVDQYIKKMMDIFGILNMGQLSIQTAYDESTKLDEQINNCIAEMNKLIDNIELINSTNHQESLFNVYNQSFSIEDENYRHKRWADYGYSRFESFEELQRNKIERRFKNE